LDDFREEVLSELAKLDEQLEKFKPRTAHYFADLVLHGYARDASTNVHATLLIVDSAWPRAAYATARAAYEAAQDALLLSSDAPAYDANGALAYAIELVEHEELRARWDSAGDEFGIARDESPHTTPEQIVDQEVQVLETMHPGGGSALLEALGEARKSGRAKQHWANKGRREIARTIEERMPKLKGTATVGDAFYGFMSVQAHPRLRGWSEQRSLTPDGILQAEPADMHRTFPIGLTLISLRLLMLAMKIRNGDVQVKDATA